MTTADPTPLDSPDALLTWRDGLVRALSTPHDGHAADAQLVNLWPLGAVLTLPEKGAVLYLVLHAGGDVPQDVVAEKIAGLARDGGAAKTHVAIVGGGGEVRDLLERVRPGFSLERKLACHHVSTDGAVWSTGGALEPLKRAAKLVGETLSRGVAIPTIDAGEAARLREGYRQLATQQARFVSAIRKGTSAVSIGLIAVNVLVFLLEMLWGGAETSPTHFRMGANAGDLSLTTEPWRLLASAFLHAGILHVGLNMMSLYALGPLLERILGPARFLVLYLASALGGAAASAWWLAGRGSSVGASGAIFGLLTATVALTFRKDDLIPAPTRAALRNGLMTPLISSIAVSAIPGVDFAAHGGGALVGFLLGLSGVLTKNLAGPGIEAKSARTSRFFAGLFVALAVGSVGMSIVHGRPWEIVQAPDWKRVQLNDGVSLEVPSQLDLQPIEREPDGSMTTSYGAIGRRDPLSVQVRVQPLDLPVPRDAEHDELAMAMKGVRESTIPGMTVETQLVDVEGRPTIVQSWKVRGEEISHAWWAIRGTRLVQITAIWPPDAPEHWKADWGRLIRSLEAP